MKSSLRKAIGLFSFGEQLKLYAALFYLKLGKKLPGELSELFTSCNNYVQLIEQGVLFTREDDVFIKANLSINNCALTVFLRKHSSDYGVLHSVLLLDEYKSAVNYMKSFPGRRPLQIIDVGGNIGLTTLYLHCFFPDARFLVIEPDKRNFAMLQKNLTANHIETATLLERALWTRTEPLVIEDSFRDGKEWSLTVDAVAPGQQTDNRQLLEGITLQAVLAVADWQTVDLLKIDIEGAERFLFEDELFLAQLQYVGAVVIEIHDEFQIREKIHHTMQKLGFSGAEWGDVTLFIRK